MQIPLKQKYCSNAFSTFPKGKIFTNVQMGQITSPREQFLSLKTVAETIGRQVGAVASFLKLLNRLKNQFKGRNATKM